MTREDAARAFAKAMGWEFVGHDDEYNSGEHPEFFGQFEWTRSDEEISASDDGDEIESLGVPPVDAPLHEHLAFAGRVAEAVGADYALRIEQDRRTGPWRVRFTELPYGMNSRIHDSEASDLSWAALLAGADAKAAR